MLTELQVKNAKPRATEYKLPDSTGLYLLVRPNGSRLWQCRYWIDKKERKASFGPYPEISLAEARARRDELKRQRALGLDPLEVRRASKEAARVAKSNSFETVAREWYGSWSRARSERHADYVMRRLEMDVFPAIGSRPVSEIQAPEIVRMVKAIEKRGALDIAKRAFQTTGQIFRYAIAHGLATDNPATKVRPSDVLPETKKTNYARIDEKELPTLMRKIRGYRGAPATRLAIELMALTFVRTGELIGARWEEFDLDRGEWRIPAARMKMRTQHIVPLSRQAIEVLRVLKEISGHRELLFPGQRDHSKPMSNGTILVALKRMGYAGKMTGHGFRGLASTILHERGFDHMHIELQLAHQERNRVTAAYNHALYLEQRVKMMQRWADFIDMQVRPTLALSVAA
jgi:integrase